MKIRSHGDVGAMLAPYLINHNDQPQPEVIRAIMLEGGLDLPQGLWRGNGDVPDRRDYNLPAPTPTGTCCAVSHRRWVMINPSTVVILYYSA